jgi:hypothetical protein
MYRIGMSLVDGLGLGAIRFGREAVRLVVAWLHAVLSHLPER